jgi:hypothetical protein
VTRTLLPVLLLLAGCGDPTLAPGGPRLDFDVDQLAQPYHNVLPQYDPGRGRLTVTGGLAGSCWAVGNLQSDTTLTLRVSSSPVTGCLSGNVKYSAAITNLAPGRYVLRVFHGRTGVFRDVVRVR